ncbi:response regulator [Nitrosopumilus cobalaminigenes]|uniref:Response regulator n=1 Tax=Nitrosopumilus cobalaminigenes TaxID=1470066 RepID=A0A7D5R7A1_9ARCH|nr:response regulator [Nitrosopumilus cobalaminigenes]QLH02641.1 response regulator [Nitrosopumilus cobalaminigenes]
MVSCIVIDDDVDIVDVFCELLNVVNVDVLGIGTDGNDALTLYEKHRPDIVFTDLQMDRCDGYHVVETIKDVYPKAKIAVITGDLNATSSLILNLLKIPIIKKPFDTHEIKQLINDIFLIDHTMPSSFEIQYKFLNDVNVYSCNVNYQQYRNFKSLPVIEECLVIDSSKGDLSNLNEMENALQLAVKNDVTSIRKLSEIVPE